MNVFNPVYKNGKISKIAAKPEDLEGLALWFLDPSENAKSLRKSAYEAVGGGVASLDSKGEFFSLVAGKSLKEYLERINYFAAEENEYGTEIEAYDFDQSSEIIRAKRLLKNLMAAFKDELFGKSMERDASMSAIEVKDLIALLRQDENAFTHMASHALVDEDDKILSTLDSFWASPESRKQMLRKEDLSTDQWGAYAPLLEHLANRMLPKEAAEFMTRFDLYIRSGWHKKDLNDSFNGGEINASFAGVLRSMHSSNPADALDAFNAFSNRFSELFLNIRAKTTNKLNIRQDSKAVIIKGAGHAKTVAGSAMIDAAILSPDKTILFASCATSDKFIQKQKNQWLRHFYATLNSAAAQEDSFQKAGIGPKTQIRFDICAPCPTSGKEGKAIEELFGSKPSRKIWKDIQALGFMSSLANALAEPEEFCLFDLKIAGDDMSTWREAISEARNLDEDKRKALISRHFVNQIGGICAEMRKCSINNELTLDGADTSNAGSWLARSMVICIMTSLEYAQKDKTGLAAEEFCKHKKDIAHFISKIAANQPSREDKSLCDSLRLTFKEFDAKTKKTKSTTLAKSLRK